MEPHEFYLNFDVLEFLGFSSWTELPNSNEFSLFPLTVKNKIEIKQGNKKILHIPANEIVAPALFPIYQIEQSVISVDDKEHHTIIIKQDEIGLFGKYELKLDRFHLDQLSFVINNQCEFLNEPSLSNLIYNQKAVKRTHEDTLVTAISVNTFDLRVIK